MINQEWHQLNCIVLNEDLYNPKSGRHSAIDGAYFGTSFPAMFFQNFQYSANT